MNGPDAEIGEVCRRGVGSGLLEALPGCGRQWLDPGWRLLQSADREPSSAGRSDEEGD